MCVIQAYVQHMNALLAVALHNYIFKHLLFPLANYIGSVGVMERRALAFFYITFLELLLSIVELSTEAPPQSKIPWLP